MRFIKRFRFRASGETPTSRNPRYLFGAAGLGVFLLGLLGGFYLAFPDTALRQRLAHEIEVRFPVRLDLAEAGLQPLLTLSGKKGVIRYPDRPESIFSIDRFSFSPFWTGIFTGDPGVKGKLLTAGGELALRWQRSGPLTMAATGIPVNIPLSASPVLGFAGILSTGQVTSAAPLQKTTKSIVDIAIEKAALQGLEALSGDAAGLRLGTLSLRMVGQGTAFTIERLEASGGDVVLSGNGTFMLAVANPRNSRINLTLSIRAGSQQDPTMANFLEFAGTPLPDGSRKLLLTGTLASPVIR
jgi:type II secretion system protein N